MTTNTRYIVRNKGPIKELLFFLSICISFSFFSCKENPAGRFVDVTHEAGIKFKYNFGDHTYENILESSGSGLTVFDYDQDGDQDLYLLNGTYLEGISDVEGKGICE